MNAKYRVLPDVAGLANTQSSGFGRVCTPAMSSAPPLDKHRAEFRAGPCVAKTYGDPCKPVLKRLRARFQ